MYERVFLLEADGLTIPFLRANLARLPNFERLFHAGAWGTLRGPLQPLAPVSLATLLTGKNPGKTGHFDFFRLPAGGYERTPLPMDSLRSVTVFDHLLAEGKTFGFVNVPHVHPTDIGQGFCVTAEDGTASLSSKPEDLRDTLEREGYPSAIGESYAPGRDLVFFDKVASKFNAQARIVRELFAKRNWDFGMYSTHHVGELMHAFWKYYDPRHPDFMEPGTVFGDADPIVDPVRWVDELIPDLEGLVGPRGLLIVASRYGHRLEYRRLHLNALLAEHGYLRFKSGPLSAVKRLAFRFGFSAARIEGLAHRMDLYKYFHFGLERSTRSALTGSVFLSFEDIDWAGTKAVAMGYQGQIFFNVRGHRPQGVVEPAEYAAECGGLRELLESLEDPATGKRAVKRVWTREELYHGSRVTDAPDLIVECVEGTSADGGFASRKPFGPSPAIHSSDHFNESVFFASGPGVIHGEIQARLEDIAPTVLKSFSVAIPDDMDGRVLSIFEG